MSTTFTKPAISARMPNRGGGLACIAVAAIMGVAACGTSSTPAHSTASSAGQPTTTAVAQSACTSLGGTLDTKQICHVRGATPTSSLDFRFPVDYPDQQAVTDFLVQRRDQFNDWVAHQPPRGSSVSYRLDIGGHAYRSGTTTLATQSLLLDIGNDTGINPVTTFKAFNYDLAKHTAITFDTLFKAGTKPLEVLNPIVQRELDKHDAPGLLTLNELGAAAYQSFAITDDAVIFFFNQDGLLPHVDGPLKVAVPRAELAPMLA